VHGGRLDDTSEGPGHFSGEHSRWGATASSLPLVGGLMTIRELQRGVIRHALSIAVPNVRANVFSLPAQRTDGFSATDTSLPEGARLRLDPDVDIGSLNLPPPMSAIARAAQRYGLYVRDKGSNVAIYGQDPTPLGTNPNPRIFGGLEPDALMWRFPWRFLQVVRMHLRAEPKPQCAPITCLG
jgi:hypothetical protein